MLDFNFYAPTYYEFGRDTESKVGELVKKFSGKRVLVHYGGGSVVRSGLLSRVEKYLDSCQIFYKELGGVKANPESDLVYEGISLCKENDIDFVLAIGGGSVIDSAKAIAAGVKYGGDFWDFFRDKDRKVIEDTLPVGVILTLAASGSEGSNSIVITNSDTKLKRGNIRCDIVRPKFAIMNPCLTMSLSNYHTACGIVDIMTHVIERYFSNKEECIVTDKLCEALLKAMLVNGKKLMDAPNDYNARANIMWASSLAHNNICGVDRVQDWASHKMEHELSGKYGVAHGAGLSVILIKWMRYVSKRNPHKFIEFGKNIFGIREDLFGNDDDYINQGIFKLQEFFIELGMPSSMEELGYKKEDLEYLVSHVDYASDGTIGNYVKLNQDDVRKIYEG